MKRLLSIAVLAGFAAICNTPAMAENSQQTKMAACNTKAGEMKGDERKAFMKTCLSAKAAPAAKPESKMAACNTASKGKTGEEKKTFMSDCMKKAA
jgi:predicted small secreted protein